MRVEDVVISADGHVNELRAMYERIPEKYREQARERGRPSCQPASAGTRRPRRSRQEGGHVHRRGRCTTGPGAVQHGD